MKSPFDEADKLLKNDAILDVASLIANNRRLVKACKGAIAALSQHRTYVSDIKAAKTFLEQAIKQTEEGTKTLCECREPMISEKRVCDVCGKDMNK